MKKDCFRRLCLLFPICPGYPNWIPICANNISRADFYTPQSLAKILGVSRSTVWQRYYREGLIAYRQNKRCKKGSPVYFMADDVIAALPRLMRA